MVMQTQDTQSPWKQAFQAGLLGGVMGVLLSLFGMVVAFSGRWIINNVFTMGQVIFLAPILLMAYSVIRRTSPQTNRNVILIGLLTGLAGGLAGAIIFLRQRVRTAEIQGLLWMVLVGLLRDLIIIVTTRWGPLAGI